MPRTLADGRTRLIALTTAPADPAAITDAELAGGTRLDNRILKSDFRLSPSDSETITEALLSEESAGAALGPALFDGCTMSVFRFLDATGAADPTEDIAFDLVKERGTHLHLVKSDGKDASATFTASDEYSYFHVVTDHPQDPEERGGYIKKRVPLLVQSAELFKSVAAGTPPAAWAASTAYSVGDQVSLTGGAVLQATVAGTSGTTEPTAPASVGGTVTDGTVTWERIS